MELLVTSRRSAHHKYALISLDEAKVSHSEANMIFGETKS